MTSLKILGLTAAIALTSQLGGAGRARAGQDYNVFDVRKSLPLADDEPVYRDYYVNMGTEEGVKVGARLLVYRRVPVLDIYRNKALADLVAPVAEIKVIHAQHALSIARLLRLVDPKRTPTLQHAAVMVGDRVELLADETESQDGKIRQAAEKPAPKPN